MTVGLWCEDVAAGKDLWPLSMVMNNRLGSAIIAWQSSSGPRLLVFFFGAASLHHETASAAGSLNGEKW